MQDRVIANARARSFAPRDALSDWRRCAYNKPDDWVFARRRYRGRRPYRGQAILRKYVRPVAQVLESRNASVGTRFVTRIRQAWVRSSKSYRKLLRHSTLRSTLDGYTQAITPAKHAALPAVWSLVFSCEANPTPPAVWIGWRCSEGNRRRE